MSKEKTFVQKLLLLQKLVNDKAEHQATTMTGKVEHIIIEVDGKLTKKRDYLKLPSNEREYTKFKSCLKTNFCSKEYINFFNSEGSIENCKLKIDACRDFLQEAFMEGSSYRITSRLDFFSVYIGFDGWKDAVRFGFDIEKKKKKENSERSVGFIGSNIDGIIFEPNDSKEKTQGVLDEHPKNEVNVSDKLNIIPNELTIEKLERVDSGINKLNKKLEIISENESISNEVHLLDRLRIGSKKYYEKLTGAYGRFRYLKISNILLPQIDSTYLETEVMLDAKKASIFDSIKQLWGIKHKHAIILGEGGMGKTVSLVKLWKQLLDTNEKNAPIPIYLALNEYNRKTEQIETKFIFNSILDNYIDKTIYKETEINAISRLFSNSFQNRTNEHKPAFVFLLDGFNEITTDYEDLLNEIDKDFKANTNTIQIIITSRYDLTSSYAWDGFNVLEICKLPLDIISVYLNKRQIYISKDNPLVEILSNPMMLTLYASTCEIQEKFNKYSEFNFKTFITSKGELIWNFIQGQLSKYFEIYKTKGDKKEFLYCKFLLMHLLPYVAYKMEKDGKYDISYFELNHLITSACNNIICDSFFRKFPEYIEHTEYFSFFNNKNSLINKRNGKFITFFKEKLCLLVKEGETFRFLHQYFRDFFSSIHLLNCINTSLLKKSIPVEFKSRTIPVYLRKLLGEITGEHLNKPLYIHKKEEWSIDHYKKTPLTKIIDNLRGEFDTKKCGLVLWNIIEILKDTRGELTGLNLSKLNLKEVNFNGVRLFRKSLNVISTNFNESLVNESNFLNQGHSDHVFTVSYSPNEETFSSSSDDKTIKEWSLKTGNCIKTYTGHSQRVRSFDYSPDGNNLISGSIDRTIRFWSTKSGKCIKTIDFQNKEITYVSYSPCGKKYLAIFGYTLIKEWSIENNETIRTYKSENGLYECASYSPNGEKIIAGNGKGIISEWDVGTGKLLHKYNGPNTHISCIAYHPDSKKFITGSIDHKIREWSTELKKCIRTFHGHKSSVTIVQYIKEGLNILSGSNDNSIKEWCTKTGNCIHTFYGHTDSVYGLSIGYKRHTFISGGWDNSIKEWSLQTGECLNTYSGKFNLINYVSYCSNSEKIVFGTKNGIIKEWSLKTGKCLQIFEGHKDLINKVIYSPNGGKILSCSADNTLKEWSIKTGNCLNTYNGHNSSVISVDYNINADKIVSGSYDGRIKCWVVDSDQCLRTFPKQDYPIYFLKFNDFEDVFYSAASSEYGGYSMKLWSVEDEKYLISIGSGTCAIFGIAIDNEDNKIVSVNSKNYIGILDIETVKGLSFNRHKEESISSVNFSKDKKRCVVAAEKNIIKEFRISDQMLINSLEGHSDRVTHVEYNFDNSKIISSSYDNSIKEWSLKTGNCKEVVKDHFGLFLIGCTFNELHPNSELSDNTRQVMIMHGAVFQTK